MKNKRFFFLQNKLSNVKEFSNAQFLSWWESLINYFDKISSLGMQNCKAQNN